MKKLKAYLNKEKIEAGCDEAGRGCLAGPVVAAAVILPKGFEHPLLNDSKKMTAARRDGLAEIIKKEAISWSIGLATVHEIDEVNILQASFLAMHRAIEKLQPLPDCLLIDGNRFNPFPRIKHHCIIGGDGLYTSIAAASVLAKTSRDEIMLGLHTDFPFYHWLNNKGYPTRQHKQAISEFGICPHHRRSFNLGKQLKLFHEADH